jgi:hypothetical protein
VVDELCAVSESPPPPQPASSTAPAASNTKSRLSR